MHVSFVIHGVSIELLLNFESALRILCVENGDIECPLVFLACSSFQAWLCGVLFYIICRSCEKRGEIEHVCFKYVRRLVLLPLSFLPSNNTPSGLPLSKCSHMSV